MNSISCLCATKSLSNEAKFIGSDTRIIIRNSFVDKLLARIFTCNSKDTYNRRVYSKNLDYMPRRARSIVNITISSLGHELREK